jgi:hypothetical protein
VIRRIFNILSDPGQIILPAFSFDLDKISTWIGSTGTQNVNQGLFLLSVIKIDWFKLNRLPDGFIQTDWPVLNAKLNPAGVSPKAQHHRVIADLTVNARAGKVTVQHF